MTDISLPSYPASTDVWHSLKKETRPILVYGMGNGADKLFSRFEIEGISVADVFASDGFVRGHSYRGYRVKSFSEVRALYSDFVIVLSFASTRPEVLSMLCELDRDYDLYIPDMPVSGDAYFDCDFYNANYDRIVAARDALSDEHSRALFCAVVQYKLSGKLCYLKAHTSDYAAILCALGREPIVSYLDGGAYTGDTLKIAMANFPCLSRAHLIEPDPKTYRRLLRTLDAVDTQIDLFPHNVALGREESTLVFHGSGNRNSSLVGASYEHRDSEIPVRSIDAILDGERVDYIKLDVEGAELDALIGADKTIRTHRPRLLVSLYHRSEDIFSLILYLHEKYPFYRLTLHRLFCVPAWELDLVCTPT